LVVLAVVVAHSAPAVATSDILMYPTKGQSQAQRDKDRYECHNWAKGRTGYDPTAPRNYAVK
jgi:hypothetical protein